ncbi:MAG: hypothetical protein HPY84_02805 [Syntrophobacteraceae bacterium]|nr:hypothetical protein [Syntrophobacteraceae bacterium]
MKGMFAVLVVAVVALVVASRSVSHAGDRVIYTRDRDGRQVETTIIREDGSVQYYDRHGRKAGSAVIRPDGSVIYYDRKGRQSGSDKARR